MWMASREDPEITLFHVACEHVAIGLHHGDTSLAVKNICSLVCGVPVHLAIAASSEAHVDPCDVF
jgi:hypothetical protein